MNDVQLKSANEDSLIKESPWSALSLTRRYALTSLPVTLSLILFIGWWVNQAIEKEVIANTAANVALYVQGFFAPELQGLADRDHVTAAESRRLEALISDTPLGKKIQSVKIWMEGGRIAYYSRHALIGEIFEPTENLKKAWQGEVSAEFDDLVDQEDSEEAELGLALLEVYSPVRQHGSDRVIAVVEFYQDAEALSSRLRDTRLNTWLVVITSTLCTYGLLFGIVRSGSRVIQRQREKLRTQVKRLAGLLDENKQLEKRLRRAAQRTTELNEKMLRRVSADLHDGPAQSMGLALLRLDAMLVPDTAVDAKSTSSDEKRMQTEGVVSEIRTTLQESMTELRNISRGLALPDLEGLTLLQTIERVIAAHVRRTSTQVELDIGDGGLVRPAGMSVKLTLYRVIQEALMNAYRHAGGQGLLVKARVSSSALHLGVSDSGPGFVPHANGNDSDRLGLHGLRERIESLGGEFSVESSAAQGTTINAILPLASVL